MFSICLVSFQVGRLFATTQKVYKCKITPTRNDHREKKLSGPLNFRTKNNFLSFFVSEKGLVHIYKKAIYYFPIPYLCFATSQSWISAKLRLPTAIRKVKFTDLVKRAMSPKMQLMEFRFHANSKVPSFLWLTKYGNFSEHSNLTSEAGRHPTLRPLITY